MELIELDNQLSKAVKTGLPVEIHFYMKRYALNIIERYVFGSSFPYNDAETNEMAFKFVQLIERLFEKLTPTQFVSDFLPALWFLDTGKKRQLRDTVNELLAMIAKIVEEHKINLDSENPKDLLDDLLIAASQDDSTFLQNKDMLLVMMDMYSAGTDSSSVSVEWFMYCLAKFPEWQDTIYNELSHLQDASEFLFLENCDKTPVLNAALKEMYRMYPIAPVGITRTNDEDDWLGGYFIPKKTLVFWNAWGYNRDPEIWDDPDHFRPDRFMEPKHASTPLQIFGLGPRMCVGANLAEEEVYAACALLCQKYKWQFENPQLHKEFDNGVLGMVLKPSSLFKVVLSERVLSWM